jgi:hypothetical protein
VVVAVVAVRVVEMAAHQVVDVVPVRHCLVPAVRAVNVAGRVRPAAVPRSARRRVRPVDRQGVLLHRPVRRRVVKVTVVKVIDVVPVRYSRVAAVRAVGVIVVRVRMSHLSILRVMGINFRTRTLQLPGVGQGIGDKAGDVLVGQRIEDVSPDPAPRDKAFGPQYSQPLRHGRELVPECRD